MKGLDLSYEFFKKSEPVLREKLSEYWPYLAFGLVGEGSECFGFDDSFSRDHDWGADFCIWIPDEMYEKAAPVIKSVYSSLDRTGFPSRAVSDQGAGRVGAMPIEGFYKKYLGTASRPEKPINWLRIPEHSFATATNGRVFLDNLGQFSAIREDFLSFYPDDVLLKKLSAKAAKAAQSGQYNYPRCAHRGENVAAQIAKSEFMKYSMGIVFLLNKTYAPFYKWTHRALCDLPILNSTAELFSDLAAETEILKCTDLIENISARIIRELRRECLSSSPSDFLHDHAIEIASNIKDPDLRRLHFSVE